MRVIDKSQPLDKQAVKARGIKVIVVLVLISTVAMISALMAHWRLRAVLYYLTDKNIQFTEVDMEKCLRQVLEHQFKR